MAGLIRSLFGRWTKPVILPTSQTDQVFPTHCFDDTVPNRHMVMCWTMRFEDVLDVEKLHASLARLLDIGDWRKLGGRLRLNVSYIITQLNFIRLDVFPSVFAQLTA
jgi:hypothetical protein